MIDNLPESGANSSQMPYKEKIQGLDIQNIS